MPWQTWEIAPLTHETFARFGDVIEYDRRDLFYVNDKMIERYHNMARVDTQEADGRTLISCLRAKPNTFASNVIKLARSGCDSPRVRARRKPCASRSSTRIPRSP